jgi:hypothetical protein
MLTTQRYLFKPEDLEGAAKALGIYETPVDGYIRAVFTRQQHDDWKYCMGQCVLGRAPGGDARELHPAFAFIGTTFYGTTVRKLLESLRGDTGLKLSPEFPALRLPVPPNWQEEIVPGQATASGMPARRFRVTIEGNAVFANDQLVAYDQPYRASAERYRHLLTRCQLAISWRYAGTGQA